MMPKIKIPAVYVRGDMLKCVILKHSNLPFTAQTVHKKHNKIQSIIRKMVLPMFLSMVATPIFAQTQPEKTVNIQFKAGQECTNYQAAWVGQRNFRMKVETAERLMIYGKKFSKLKSLETSQYALSSSDGKIEGDFQDHFNAHSYGFFNQGNVHFSIKSLENKKHHIMFCLYDW